jgi:hypothetical protein
MTEKINPIWPGVTTPPTGQNSPENAPHNFRPPLCCWPNPTTPGHPDINSNVAVECPRQFYLIKPRCFVRGYGQIIMRCIGFIVMWDVHGVWETRSAIIFENINQVLLNYYNATALQLP